MVLTGNRCLLWERERKEYSSRGLRFDPVHEDQPTWNQCMESFRPYHSKTGTVEDITLYPNRKLVLSNTPLKGFTSPLF